MLPFAFTFTFFLQIADADASCPVEEQQIKRQSKTCSINVSTYIEKRKKNWKRAHALF
jgi:hypothetical protein